jgi:ferrous iron transport protein B
MQAILDFFDLSRVFEILMPVRRKIALVGQPNVGKSVLFGAMTGKYASVSNYPGTTVEVTRGALTIGGEHCELIDTPGLYSVFPVTEEERVTLRIIKDERPSLIIHVADTKNLERMLPLTFQLKETGIPVVLVLNMFDEAKDLGITVDTARLSESLGIPVTATVAVDGRGVNQLLRVVEDRRISGPASVTMPAFSQKRAAEWHRAAADIAGAVFKKRPRSNGLSRIDRVVLHPVGGGIILLVILYLGLYKFVGRLGAGVVVDLLDGFFETGINPRLQAVLNACVPWQALRGLFGGEYGIITLGLRYALAIILPIVGFFFLVFALIEDSGYLPRLSFLLDRIFKKIGLSGKAVIPMVLGLGCATMATVVTRTLPTRRERLIATLLLSLCIPCSAQLGVIMGLLSGTPDILFAWFLIIAFIFGVVGALVSRFVPGTAPSFMIEVPPMRMPQVKNVLYKTFARMKWYLFEIIPLFILASALIWLGQMTGLFGLLVRAMALPLRLIGLPASAAPAFIFGFFRRDYGAAGLYDLHQKGAFDNAQLLIAVVVLTLFLPCITQFLVTVKERGWKTALGISLFVLAVAFTAGFVINTIRGIL